MQNQVPCAAKHMHMAHTAPHLWTAVQPHLTKLKKCKWKSPTSRAAWSALHSNVHRALCLNWPGFRAVCWVKPCWSSLGLHEAGSDLACHICNSGRGVWHKHCGGAFGHSNVLQHVKVLCDHHHLNDVSGADIIDITLKIEYLHTLPKPKMKLWVIEHGCRWWWRVTRVTIQQLC